MAPAKDPAWMGYAAGTAGGVSLTLVGHPLDTLKVRLQTMPTPKAGEAPKFTGMLDCASKTLRNEGAGAFYKGVLSPLWGIGGIYALTFGVNEFLRGAVRKTPDSTLSIPEIAVCGGIAGSAAFVLTTPIELVKSKLQVQYSSGAGARYTGMIDCATSTVKAEGALGLWRGAIPTIARDCPASMAWYSTYEVMKRALTPEGEAPSTATLLFSGGMGGIMNWCVMYPIDVVKTTIQTAEPGTYKGMIDCFKTLYAQGGMKPFFRGLAPCLVRAFPANAACFYGYEVAMDAFRGWEADAME